MTATHAKVGSIAHEHFDVLIVGAGISGICGAYHLTRECPQTRFVVLDALESYGGTWLTHSYPGARTDSDMFTFGYSFKPWTGASTADRDQILSYLGEVIEENRLSSHIRYRHTICSASWSSETNLWTIEASADETGDIVRFTTGFLWMCQGYYRHSEGYTPEWAGMESFSGQVVHPQKWPDDLEYADKNILVIGSGATAATLVPALAKKARHVAMLQRTPTYFAAERSLDTLADELQQLDINREWFHEILRRKSVHDRAELLRNARHEPEAVKQKLLDGVRASLGTDFDIDTHFNPPYSPLQQRLAFVPEGDLFQAMRERKASIVTDEIEAFTESGVLLKSGDRIDADIVVTATGFNVSLLGDIDFSIDGKPLSFPETVTYRGMMFTGVPNLVWVMGYFFYSWTMRVELIAEFVCRLLDLMKQKGVERVTPTLREKDQDMKRGPWVDPEDFNPGYMMRSKHLFPNQGDKPEWQHSQDYLYERAAFADIDLDDALFSYGGGRYDDEERTMVQSARSAASTKSS